MKNVTIIGARKAEKDQIVVYAQTGARRISGNAYVMKKGGDVAFSANIIERVTSFASTPREADAVLTMMRDVARRVAG